MTNLTCENISADIAKGKFPVHMPLTNMSIAAYQNLNNNGATAFMPICPVSLSTAFYYIFDKGDLNRDNVRTKPIMGKVDPAVIASSQGTYRCIPEQIILGFDRIAQSDYQRSGAPGSMNLYQSKSKIIANQMFIHQNRMFAQKFFKAGVWGQDITPAAKWDTTGSDPIGDIQAAATEQQKNTGRRPNRFGIGREAFDSLIKHESFLERVSGSGSTPNPAIVNESVLAAVLGVDKVVVFDSIYNSGALGQTNMEFICDGKSALLAYATDSPAIDEPSAGYTFTWDMGIGQMLPVLMWDGENGTHSEFIEGLMAWDMEVTAKDMGTFFSAVVD